MARKKPAVAPTAAATPKTKLIRAADVKIEQAEYLWLDRVPLGELTLVGGRPQQGKSLFSNFLAAYVTKQGGAVIMSNPEDALTWRKVPRLIAAGADMRLVHFWPGKIRLPGDIEELEFFVQTQGVKLVTIDPIGKHITGRDPNTALEPLAAMAERCKIAVVGIHHVNKRIPRDADPMDVFGGSYGGWIGSVRSAHVLGPASQGDEDARFMVAVKGNHAKIEDLPAVEFFLDGHEIDLPNGVTVETAAANFVSAKAKVIAEDVIHYHGSTSGFKHQEAGGEKHKATVELLSLLLARGPMKATDVFTKGTEMGVSKNTVKRAKAELEIISERRSKDDYTKGANKEDSAIWWRLPDDHPMLKTRGAAIAAMKAPAPTKKGTEDEIDKLLADILSNNKPKDGKDGS